MGASEEGEPQATAQAGGREPTWWRAAVCRLALLAIAVLVLFLALEAALRSAATPPPARWHDRSDFFYQPDPERDHPWSRNATNGLSIAVIGDSFTRGVGVQIDDRYAARIERLLNLHAGAPPVDVRVFDSPGTSTYMQLGLLRDALKARPQLVILGVCLNDAEDWTPPDKIREWRRETLPYVPGPAMAAVLRRSRLLSWVYLKLGHLRAAQGHVRYYHRLYQPDYSGFRRFRESLGIFQKECREADAKLLIVVFPLLDVPLDKGRYPFADVHAVIDGLLVIYGIPHVDLLDSLRGTLPVRMQAVPGIDPHPSEIAHRMAAEAIVRTLLERGLIDPVYALPERPTESVLPARWESTRARMQDPLSRASEGRKQP